MVSVILFFCGLSELLTAIFWEDLAGLWEYRDWAKSTPKATRDEKIARFGKASKEPVVAAVCLLNMMEYVGVLGALVFAFTVTFWTLFVPMVAISVLAHKTNSKKNKHLFVLDQCFCAFLFFVAAGRVA